jgi:hypothetical protein
LSLTIHNLTKALVDIIVLLMKLCDIPTDFIHKPVTSVSNNRTKREASLKKIRDPSGTCGKIRVKQKSELSFESILIDIISSVNLNRKLAGLGEFPYIVRTLAIFRTAELMKSVTP